MPPFSKPTKLPEWASGGTADVVEPTSGEKSLGWVAGQTPPAPYMNWLMGGDFGYFPWLQYLQTFEQNALTWPERQTFQKGVEINNSTGTRSKIFGGVDVTGGASVSGGLGVDGALLVDKVTPAAGTGVLGAPLLDFPLPNGRYLTARHLANASPARYGRAYVTPTGFEFSINAGWDTVNSRWVADSTASPAVLFRLTGSSIRVCRLATPPANFLDSAFTEVIVADSTTGARGQALGYAADGLAAFTNSIRSASVLAGSTTFPWNTPGVWSTSDATAWADVTGCGNLTGAMTANNATIQGQIGPVVVATLPPELRPASGAEAHGSGYYIPPSGTTSGTVRVSVNSSGQVILFYIPSNGLTGTATILLPCLHWRLQTG